MSSAHTPTYMHTWSVWYVKCSCWHWSRQHKINMEWRMCSGRERCKRIRKKEKGNQRKRCLLVLLLLAKTGWPTYQGCAAGESECSWRPGRPPRNSSHTVCVCVLGSLMTYCFCLCGVQALKRYWTSHGERTHIHTHSSSIFLFPFHLSIKHTVGESHGREIW